MPFFNVFADVIQHTAARFFSCTLDGTNEGERVGGTVALHHDAFQSEETGAVVAAMIQSVLESLEDRHGHHCPQLSEQILAKALFQEAAHHLGHAFGCLQGDVAHEPVAYHHVGDTLEDVV